MLFENICICACGNNLFGFNLRLILGDNALLCNDVTRLSRSDNYLFKIDAGICIFCYSSFLGYRSLFCSCYRSFYYSVLSCFFCKSSGRSFFYSRTEYSFFCRDGFLNRFLWSRLCALRWELITYRRLNVYTVFHLLLVITVLDINLTGCSLLSFCCGSFFCGSKNGCFCNCSNGSFLYSRCNRSLYYSRCCRKSSLFCLGCLANYHHTVIGIIDSGLNGLCLFCYGLFDCLDYLRNSTVKVNRHKLGLTYRLFCYLFGYRSFCYGHLLFYLFYRSFLNRLFCGSLCYSLCLLGCKTLLEICRFGYYVCIYWVIIGIDDDRNYSGSVYLIH